MIRVAEVELEEVFDSLVDDWRSPVPESGDELTGELCFMFGSAVGGDDLESSGIFSFVTGGPASEDVEGIAGIGVCLARRLARITRTCAGSGGGYASLVPKTCTLSLLT